MHLVLLDYSGENKLEAGQELLLEANQEVTKSKQRFYFLEKAIFDMCLVYVGSQRHAIEAFRHFRTHEWNFFWIKLLHLAMFEGHPSLVAVT